jgi:hypothetical protein
MGCTPEQARSSRNFDIISQKLSFVKSFFQAFSNFVSFLLFFRRSLKRSHILAHAPTFVNTFFQLFSPFFDFATDCGQDVQVPPNI